MLINGKTLPELKAEYEHAESVGLKCDDEIQLVEALMSAEMDAERYRFLRDDAFENSDDVFLEAGRMFSELTGNRFDNAVDAAIEAGKKW